MALKRGKILRIKPGYNPNSSSVGSLVATFLWSAGIGLVMLQILAYRLFKDRPGAGGDAH